VTGQSEKAKTKNITMFTSGMSASRTYHGEYPALEMTLAIATSVATKIAK
jgi:hypothetical protein